MAYVALDPGWLERQAASIKALDRAKMRILARANGARKNGLTRPVSIEFTVEELRALAYAVRHQL